MFINAFRLGVARRENLEDNGHGHVAFLPLFPGGAVSLGPTEDDVDVRGSSHFVLTFDRIPELIATHEDVGVVTEQGGEVAVENKDPDQLFGIVGHRFAIAFEDTPRLSANGA